MRWSCSRQIFSHLQSMFDQIASIFSHGPAHRLELVHGMIVWKAVCAGPRRRGIVALNRLDHVLPHRHGDQVRRRHATLSTPTERSVHLKRGRSELALHDIARVLVDDRPSGRDGGARVWRKRKSRIRQRRGAGLCGGRIERAVVDRLGQLAVESRAGL